MPPPPSATALEIRDAQDDAASGARVVPFVQRPLHLSEAPSFPPPDPPPAAGPRFSRAPYVRRPKLGEILLEMGAIDPADLAQALMLQRRLSARLGDVLLRRGLLDEATLAEALGRQRAMGQAGPAPQGCPAADALARRLPMQLALEYRALPWRRVGRMTLIATSRPEGVDALRAKLPPDIGPCLFAVVTDSALEARMHEVHGAELARTAECRVPEGLSCRLWRARPGAALLALALVGLLLVAALWPMGTLRVATILGLCVMASNLGLRVAAVIALRRRPSGFASVRPAGAAVRDLPCISILVPLHREPDIAGPLTERLSRLDYPRELLDICLVVEADDIETLEALDRARLPEWMRVIPVPDGQPRTKPRAMNYALNFTRGSVVGIYDAEDAPAPDQLMKVAVRFRAAPARVACLQGMLDYYNPTRNWMSRCFTIEYANWFRLVLPGIARLGLVVPLGGTTLFFRRDALERVGGWDAHNVTEDADLGVRLARCGYRTELIATTTLEEANASPLAWVKQRSRWMKGYVLTWAVHARNPLQLWSDLGPRRFFGFHLLFLGSILNALLMPVLWSTAVMLLGWHHPILDVLPGDGILALSGLFLLGMLVSLSITWLACAAPHHRRLRPWILTMGLYFPLATLALAKALFEIVLRPFHWDKTTHGTFGGTGSADISELEQSLCDAVPPRRAGDDRRAAS